MIPTFLLHIANKNPTRNHIIIGVFECQEIMLFFLPWCKEQSTYTPWLGPAELLLFHCTPPTATFPDRKSEMLVIKTPQARTGLRRAKQMPGTGRACYFTEAFLQAGSMLAHAAGRILLCLITLKAGAVEGEKRGQLSVFMFERNKGEQRTEWECLRQRCVRDRLFLLGQHTSLGPPA